MFSNNLVKKLALFALISIVVITLAFKNNPASQTGWHDLFDGKTMNGWKVMNQDFANPNNQPEFYIENKMIICNSTTKNKGGGYLITEKSYSNFILELDVKIDTTLNSGVQCRSRVWEKDTATYFNGSTRKSKWPKGYVWGYQIEIDPSSRAWSGGLYEPGNRGWLVTLKNNKKAQKAFKPLDWNHFKILMDGNKIQTWVNNIPIVDTTDNMSSSGFIGLQFHGAYTEIQNNKKSMWKNIRIKEL